MARLGITGHRGLGDATTRLVDRGLRSLVATYDPATLAGVTNLADGADQLFAQAVLDHGGRLEVIVPAQTYRDGLPTDCHLTYDRLHARASRVLQLDHLESTSASHMAASEAMLETIDELLAVWDGKPARGYGGTADVVRAARDRSIPVHVVWPAGATRDLGQPELPGIS
ncbi:MAG: hypothetical protein ACRDPK_04490 [Carbonactinosporaceae bacterium]